MPFWDYYDWWPMVAPFFSSGQHGSRALFLRSRLVSLRSDHVGECKPLHSTQSHAPARPKVTSHGIQALGLEHTSASKVSQSEAKAAAQSEF